MSGASVTNKKNNTMLISLGTLGLFIDNIVSCANKSSGVEGWKIKSDSFDTSAAVTEGKKEWEAFTNDHYTVKKDKHEVAYMPCNLNLRDEAESIHCGSNNCKASREQLSDALGIPFNESTVEQWMAVIGRVEEKMAGAVSLKEELQNFLRKLGEFSESSTGSTTTYLRCMDMFRNIGSMGISISTSNVGSQGKKISERIIGCVLNMAGLEESTSRTGHHSLPFQAKDFDKSPVYWKRLQMCFQAKLCIVEVYKDVLKVVRCMSGPVGGGHSILGISSLGQRSRYVLPRMKN